MIVAPIIPTGIALGLTVCALLAWEDRRNIAQRRDIFRINARSVWAEFNRRAINREGTVWRPCDPSPQPAVSNHSTAVTGKG